jgi:hypothetical protein
MTKPSDAEDFQAEITGCCDAPMATRAVAVHVDAIRVAE